MRYFRPIGIDYGTRSSSAAMLTLDEQTLIKTHPLVQSGIEHAALGQNEEDSASVPNDDIPLLNYPRQIFSRSRLIDPPTRGDLAKRATARLRRIREEAEGVINEASLKTEYAVERAVMALPMCFDLGAAEILSRGAHDAGLKIVEYMPAPLAAVLYYNWKHHFEDSTALIYSFGGGSFDACVIRSVQGELFVLGAAGESFLGGVDIDRRLARSLAEKLSERGFDLSEDEESRNEDRALRDQFIEIAEDLKHRLTAEDTAAARFPEDLKDGDDLELPSDFTFERQDLDEAAHSLVEHTLSLTRLALKRAYEKGGVTAEEIKHVLLSGGSIGLPSIRPRLSELLGVRQAGPIGPSGVNQGLFVTLPDHAVAAGAALRGAALGVGVRDDSSKCMIWFLSSSVTDEDMISFRGKIEDSSTDEPLEDHTLYVTDGNRDLVDEVDVGTDGRFSVPDIDLEEEGESLFRFALLTPQGLPAAEVERPVFWNHDAKELPQGGDRTADFARDRAAQKEESHDSTSEETTPRSEHLPTARKIQEIEERFNAAFVRASISDCHEAESDFVQCASDIREALALGDHPKAIKRYGDLEGIFREVSALADAAEQNQDDAAGEEPEVKLAATSKILHVSGKPDATANTDIFGDPDASGNPDDLGNPDANQKEDDS